MPEYKAPMRDIEFVLYELLDMEGHYAKLPHGEDATRDILDAVLGEGAKFTEQVLAPLNQVGDQEGCRWTEDGVVTPKGFKDAYDQYVAGGWPSLAAPAEIGGQGLPESVSIVMNEMIGSANWAWGMYPGLSHGAVNTLEAHGSDEQKKVYLEKLISGEWTGTMCLTESHCGSDLGLLRTKAEPNADGSYNITGTKIFISAGDHDLTDNIVHIVLARLPDAPKGTRGISLFVVPKFLPDENGDAGESNKVTCGAIEHKMGIHGNATCVMNFDGAKGWLVGPENRGLNCMFTFMNFARIGTALQGLGASEASFQGALAYARERLAMRSLSGPKNPEGEADPIIVHPDVRRMLLTQKAFAEGGRALSYFLGKQADLVLASESEVEREKANQLLDYLTPIAKAFLTETGFESANLGVQVFGGHGFITEWGMEQIVRDARIAMLYEGTTGIQALDLLGRKVMLSRGETLKSFSRIVYRFCKENGGNPDLKPMIKALEELNGELTDLSLKIGANGIKDADEIGAAAVDYMMYSGYYVLAYFWADMARLAQEKLAAGTSEEAFYQAKIKTAKFYFDRILPRCQTHRLAILAGAESLMEMDVEQFAF